MTEHAAIAAFEVWWLSKPDDKTPSPSQCGISEEDAMSIWLSAWRMNNHFSEYKLYENTI